MNKRIPKALVAILLLVAMLHALCACSFLGVYLPMGEGGETPSAKPQKTEDTNTKAEGTPSVTTPITPPSEDCTHQWGVFTVTVQPTCEQEGEQVRTCALCKGQERETLPERGHTPVPTETIPAGCFTAGKEGGTHCEICKKVLQAPTVTLPLEHSYEGNICSRCGTPKGSAEGLAYLSLYNSTYGYDYLGEMPNGEARQTLYRSIDLSVRTFHTDPGRDGTRDGDKYKAFSVTYSDLGLSTDAALEVWKTFRDDNPLYYWISNSLSYNEERLNVLVTAEYADGEARVEQNRAIYETIAEYIALVPETTDSYEKALILHDALVDAIDYAFDESGHPETADWAHSIVGVFTERGAVCEGFARAYQLLLGFCGEECVYVTGDGNGEAHAWNLLRVGDEWYGVDVTWDDNNSETYPYLYFCLSETEFAKTHQKDLPTESGLDFLYAVPTLAEHSLQWVELSQDGTDLGLFPCLAEAIESMTDKNADYSLTLCVKGAASNGKRLHIPAGFTLPSDLPEVKSLTITGEHTLLDGGSFSATLVYLSEDLVLSCDLTLKSLFLTANEALTLTQNGFDLTYGTNRTYYSAILEAVTVR